MGLVVVIVEAGKSKGLVAASAWASGQGCLPHLNMPKSIPCQDRARQSH